MKKPLTFNQLSRFRISPKHYQHYLNDKEAQELDRKQDLFSDALIDYLLNPEEFSKKYIVLMDSSLPFKVKDREKFKKDFAASFYDKIVIEQYYHDLIKNITPNAQSTCLKLYVDSAAFPTGVFTKDHKTGIELQYTSGRVPVGPLIGLHICDRAITEVFQKTIFYKGYHNKAAWDMNIIRGKNEYMIFALENDAPYTCQPFSLKKDAIEAAHRENRMLIDILAWCNMHEKYLNYSGFNLIKEIYKSKELGDKDFDTAMYELDSFLKIDPGYHLAETPSWVF